MGKYSFYCKYCGASHSFDTKEDKKTYEKFHYETFKKYPGLKLCRNLVRTTNGTIMRIDAAKKIDEENQKKAAEVLKQRETVEMDWNKLKDPEN